MIHENDATDLVSGDPLKIWPFISESELQMTPEKWQGAKKV